jgi:hypothetical protein
MVYVVSRLARARTARKVSLLRIDSMAGAAGWDGRR